VRDDHIYGDACRYTFAGALPHTDTVYSAPFGINALRANSCRAVLAYRHICCRNVGCRPHLRGTSLTFTLENHLADFRYTGLRCTVIPLGRGATAILTARWRFDAPRDYGNATQSLTASRRCSTRICTGTCRRAAQNNALNARDGRARLPTKDSFWTACWLDMGCLNIINMARFRTLTMVALCVPPFRQHSTPTFADHNSSPAALFW